MPDKEVVPMAKTTSLEPIPGPKMEPVVTGKHILTGEPVVKQRAVPKPAPDYNTGDRAPYTVLQAVTGSLNRRRFDLKEGDTVNLNADEAKLLASYVTKVKL